MSSRVNPRRWRTLAMTIAIVSLVFSTGGGGCAEPDDSDPTEQIEQQLDETEENIRDNTP